MEHCIQHDCWSGLGYTCFYDETVTQDRFLHTQTLCFLHFADNSQTSDEGREYDRLGKLRTVSDKLYAKFCYHLGHLGMDKVCLNSGAGLLSGSILPLKENVSTSEFNKVCDESGYTCDLRVYLG